jgi:ketosteroid isomerase-like protein
VVLTLDPPGRIRVAHLSLWRQRRGVFLMISCCYASVVRNFFSQYFLENAKRMSYVLCLLIAAYSAPVLAADDGNLKQELEKMAAAYADGFNKQDAAGIAALYAAGGVHVTAAGPTTEIAKRYEGAFKAGFNHNEITVDQVWPVGGDVVVATGEYHLTGKNSSGAPIEGGGIWTSTDVREGGVWKIKMLSAFPKAPPPKDWRCRMACSAAGTPFSSLGRS